MEITYEEAEATLAKRIDENPKIKAFVADPNFKKTLAELVAFEEIDPALLPTIEWEILIVLGLYAPLSELAQNISESTDLPLEKTEGLCVMIESILLETIYDDLSAFDLFWKSELEKEKSLPEAPKDFREKLELRPEGIPPTAISIPTDSPKPLTREEVLQALAPRRTMATDIEGINQKKVATGQPPASTSGWTHTVE